MPEGLTTQPEEGVLLRPEEGVLLPPRGRRMAGSGRPVNHEALAVHAALWGDPDALLDAFDDGTWSPDLFTDEGHRRTAETIATMVAEGIVPWPENVARRLVADGLSAAEAWDAIDPPGAFAANGYRLDGLGYWLHRLAEDAERERLRAELVRLGHVLEVPGGPERVLAALAEVAA